MLTIRKYSQGEEKETQLLINLRTQTHNTTNFRVFSLTNWLYDQSSIFALTQPIPSSSLNDASTNFCRQYEAKTVVCLVRISELGDSAAKTG
jgi:hypothetical protein